MFVFCPISNTIFINDHRGHPKMIFLSHVVVAADNIEQIQQLFLRIIYKLFYNKEPIITKFSFQAANFNFSLF